MSYTPAEAKKMFDDFMKFFPAMGRLIIRGSDLEDFEEEVQIAHAVAALPPTSATCGELETCLGLMSNLFLDAALLATKPRHQVQEVLDAIDFTGTALAIAAGTWTAGRAGALH